MKKHKLDNLIICKRCHTLHKKIKLHRNTKALCKHCGSVIYRNHHNIIETTLALSISAIIALMVAFSFTIMTININGIYQELNLTALFVVIFEQHFYLVGIMLGFLIFLFPLAILVSIILLLTLMHFRRSGYLVKRLLILTAKLLPWSMIDIFFISILVSMVKLFDYAQIEIGVAFVAFILLLVLDIIINKQMRFNELWRYYESIYGVKNEQS